MSPASPADTVSIGFNARMQSPAKRPRRPGQQSGAYQEKYDGRQMVVG
ncbi:MAG: hypothetical protein ABIY70_24310 [Capsulimonas sp.]